MTTQGRLFVLVFVVVAACRPDPGVPDYSSHEGMRDVVDAGGPDLGPDPWVPGEPRAAFGLFYEGGATVTYAPDATRHYYIFPNGDSYEQVPDETHVEGVVSDRLTLTGLAWWGGGFVWDEPTDLSAFTTMRVSLLSEDPGFAQMDLKVLSGATGTAAEFAVKASAYGFVTDGEWHHLEIPLADFAAKGFNAAACRGPFVVAGVGGNSGESLLIDAMYFE